MKTTLDKIALLLTLWVVTVGGYAVYVNPEPRVQCLLGIGVLGVAWALRQICSRYADTNAAMMEARRSITQSIVFVGLMLSEGWFVALGWVADSGEFRMRASQFLAGAMVIVFANVIPKKAVTSRRLATLLRANGRALFLGGLGYALAWLLLPLAYANEVALSALLLAFAYVFARIVFCVVDKNRSVPPAGSA